MYGKIYPSFDKSSQDVLEIQQQAKEIWEKWKENKMISTYFPTYIYQAITDLYDASIGLKEKSKASFSLIFASEYNFIIYNEEKRREVLEELTIFIQNEMNAISGKDQIHFSLLPSYEADEENIPFAQRQFYVDVHFTFTPKDSLN